MMTEQNREQLSAAMDGRLSQDELRFLLRRMEHDESLSADWSRYHLVRDGLRGPLPPLAGADFSARVARAIEAEAAAPIALAPARRRRWLQWSAGGAIAASVAVAALMVAQPGSPVGGNAPGAGVVASVTSDAASSRGMDVAAVGSPATVPAWLSGNSASALSQRASATLGAGPDGGMELNSSRALAAYQLHHYRAVSNNDGSYLLLIDPAEPADTARSAQVDAPAIH